MPSEQNVTDNFPCKYWIQEVRRCHWSRTTNREKKKAIKPDNEFNYSSNA